MHRVSLASIFTVGPPLKRIGIWPKNAPTRESERARERESERARDSASVYGDDEYRDSEDDCASRGRDDVHACEAQHRPTGSHEYADDARHGRARAYATYLHVRANVDASP